MTPYTLHRPAQAPAPSVLRDAGAAVREFDEALAWICRPAGRSAGPLAAEVWVYDRDLTHVLLVKHRVRGWVPPGGRVELGETPRQAAQRELAEETGLRIGLLPRAAAVTVRSYRWDWEPAFGLSYAAMTDRAAPVAGEPGQPLAWTALADGWASVFPDDVDRIRWHAGWLRGNLLLPVSDDQ